MAKITLSEFIVDDVAGAVKDAAWNLARRVAAQRVDAESGSMFFTLMPESEEADLKIRIEALMEIFANLVNHSARASAESLISEVMADIQRDDERLQEAAIQRDAASAALADEEVDSEGYAMLLNDYHDKQRAWENALSTYQHHRRA